MAPKKATVEMTQAAIQKLVNDSIANALRVERETVAVAEAARLAAATGNAGGSGVKNCSYKDFKSGEPTKFRGTEGATAMVRWFEKLESVFLLCNCPDDSKVKFATSTLLDGALSWWNSYAQPIGMENAFKLKWEEFKGLVTKKFCPRTEVKKLETEFYELVTIGYDIDTYIRRFQELAALCPSMVSDNEKLLEAFIGGLPEVIQGDVTSFDPQTIEEAIRVTQKLMAQVVKRGKYTTNRNNNNPNNRFNNNRANYNNNSNNNKRKWDNTRGRNATQQPPKRQEVAKVYAAGQKEGKGYTGVLPKCNKCLSHHNPGRCPDPCENCKKVGHRTRDCKSPQVTCFGCGEPGHYKRDCKKGKNQANPNQGGMAQGRVYVIGGGEDREDPNVITG